MSWSEKENREEYDICPHTKPHDQMSKPVEGESAD